MNLFLPEPLESFGMEQVVPSSQECKSHKDVVCWTAAIRHFQMQHFLVSVAIHPIFFLLPYLWIIFGSLFPTLKYSQPIQGRLFCLFPIEDQADSCAYFQISHYWIFPLIPCFYSMGLNSLQRSNGLATEGNISSFLFIRRFPSGFSFSTENVSIASAFFNILPGWNTCNQNCRFNMI